MPSSPTARDAAEGLAEIEDVLAEHKAGRISGSLAASTIGLKFLKHQGPLLAALRSADTEGGETQGGTSERALRDGLSPDGRTAARSEPTAFDPARTALAAAVKAMESATVFVTSRERIKRPEGEDWWENEIALARAALIAGGADGR